MTFEIACSKCGGVLYSGFELKPPAEIIRQFDGRCKECGVALMTDAFKVDVEKFGGSFVPSHPQESPMGFPIRMRPPPARAHIKSEVPSEPSLAR